ncbi:MAG TPA: DUF962 domain-containing protein [Saprospiraceae bacterium]|nr:DUF962 domain-containing protein [Saprospiraceae bacterium]
MITSRLQSLLQEYGESHQNSTNKLFHWICVPIIYFSIIGILMSIPQSWPKSWWSNFASIGLSLALIYYFKLSWRLAIFFLVLDIVFLMANWSILKWYGWNQLNLLYFSLTLFLIAWIGQFIGHKVEGKKPSFFKDLQFLLIGPAWLGSFIIPSLSK